MISIDILRALAALSVFVYHVRAGAQLTGITGISLFSYIDVLGAYYAVPLFFLISGYCIHLSNLKYIKAKQSLPVKEYYKLRLLRIIPPYIFAVFFSLTVNLIIDKYYTFGWKDLFVHLFLLQGFSASYFNRINVVFWTITVEIAFYILYPAFYYVRNKYSLTTALLISFVISAVSITYFTSKNSINLPEQYFFLNLWFAWCCGAFIADRRLFNAADFQKPVYKIIYGVIVVLFIFFRFSEPGHLVIINYQVNILIWTLPLLFLLHNEHWFAKRPSFLIKILSAIGLSSYSLYLFHEPLIFLKNYSAHLLFPPSLQPAGVILGTFFIPVITWFSYLYIERPFMKRKNNLVLSGKPAGYAVVPNDTL